MTPRAHPPSPPPHPVVLIVEDDATTRAAMLRLLRHHGVTAESAGDVLSALMAIDRFRPRHVLLDALLPDGTGADVMEYLRLRGIRARVAVITGAADPAVADHYHGLGAELVLRKPILPSAVLDWLEAPTHTFD